MSDALGQVALAVLAVLLLGTMMFAVARGVRRARARDAERVAEVERAFASVAARRGLALRRLEPLVHPVIGRVPVPPRVHGASEGLALRLTVEADPEGDTWTSLVVERPRAERPWPSPEGLADPARSALARLRAEAQRVELGPDALVVVPRAEAETDANGRTHRIQVDPEQLDAALALALDLARALRQS